MTRAGIARMIGLLGTVAWLSLVFFWATPTAWPQDESPDDPADEGPMAAPEVTGAATPTEAAHAVMMALRAQDAEALAPLIDPAVPNDVRITLTALVANLRVTAYRLGEARVLPGGRQAIGMTWQASLDRPAYLDAAEAFARAELADEDLPPEAVEQTVTALRATLSNWVDDALADALASESAEIRLQRRPDGRWTAIGFAAQVDRSGPSAVAERVLTALHPDAGASGSRALQGVVAEDADLFLTVPNAVSVAAFEILAQQAAEPVAGRERARVWVRWDVIVDTRAIVGSQERALRAELGDLPAEDAEAILDRERARFREQAEELRSAARRPLQTVELTRGSGGNWLVSQLVSDPTADGAATVEDAVWEWVAAVEDGIGSGLWYLADPAARPMLPEPDRYVWPRAVRARDLDFGEPTVDGDRATVIVEWSARFRRDRFIDDAAQAWAEWRDTVPPALRSAGPDATSDEDRAALHEAIADRIESWAAADRLRTEWVYRPYVADDRAEGGRWYLAGIEPVSGDADAE